MVTGQAQDMRAGSLRLTATLPLIARVCAGAQRCPLTLTRVEFGAPRWRFGDCLAQAGRQGAQAPAGGGQGTRWGGCRASKAVKKGVKKGRATLVEFFEAINGKILSGRIVQ